MSVSDDGNMVMQVIHRTEDATNSLAVILLWHQRNHGAWPFSKKSHDEHLTRLALFCQHFDEAALFMLTSQ